MNEYSLFASISGIIETETDRAVKRKIFEAYYQGYTDCIRDDDPQMGSIQLNAIQEYLEAFENDGEEDE